MEKFELRRKIDEYNNLMQQVGGLTAKEDEGESLQYLKQRYTNFYLSLESFYDLYDLKLDELPEDSFWSHTSENPLYYKLCPQCGARRQSMLDDFRFMKSDMADKILGEGTKFPKDFNELNELKEIIQIEAREELMKKRWTTSLMKEYENLGVANELAAIMDVEITNMNEILEYYSE